MHCRIPLTVGVRGLLGGPCLKKLLAETMLDKEANEATGLTEAQVHHKPRLSYIATGPIEDIGPCVVEIALRNYQRYPNCTISCLRVPFRPPIPVNVQLRPISLLTPSKNMVSSMSMPIEKSIGLDRESV
jgi:hypothetical protein